MKRHDIQIPTITASKRTRLCFPLTKTGENGNVKDEDDDDDDTEKEATTSSFLEKKNEEVENKKENELPMSKRLKENSLTNIIRWNGDGRRVMDGNLAQRSSSSGGGGKSERRGAADRRRAAAEIRQMVRPDRSARESR